MSYPVTQQPMGDYGFQTPGGQQSLPGLEVLMQSQKLKVKQRRPGCLELFGCWEYSNKYDVWNEQGDKVFFMKEESGCLDRICCANIRALQVSFQDLQGNELLRFDRPLRCVDCCCNGCYPNWTQLLEVYYQGQELGKIREVPICCTRKHLEVWGKNDQKIYDISGPCIPCSCGGDVPFQIESSGGEVVGEIAKKWRGCCAEGFTDMDTFQVEFPAGADVATKALLMGATMLVDYMYFERQNSDNSG